MSNSRKTVSFYLILLLAFIDVMGVGLVYPMFSSMLYQGNCQILPHDTSDAARGLCLGVLLAMMPLVQFFSSPILGAISDYKGRKKVLIFCLIVGIAGYLFAMIGVHLESFSMLLLSRVFIGISAGSCGVAEASIADSSSQEDKAKNFGLFNMAFGLGFAAGPFLGGKLSNVSFLFLEGYAVPFFFAASLMLLNLGLVLFFFKETFYGKEKLEISIGDGIRNLIKVFKLQNLRVIFTVSFLVCCGWSFFWEFIPVTLIGEYQFTSQDIGNLYGYGALFYALSCGLLIRPIFDRFQTYPVLFYSLIICGVSIGALLFHVNPVWLWIYVPVQQYMMAIFYPASTALVSNETSADIQGEVLGAFQSIQALAFGVSPLIAGALLAISLQMPIIVGAISMLLGAGVLAISLKGKLFSKAYL